MFTPYSEVTHLCVSGRGLWLGTRRTVWLLPWRLFPEKGGPAALAPLLRARLAQQPEGAAQLARIAEVDRLAGRPSRRVVIRLVAVLCLAASILTLRDPFVYDVGAFVPELVAEGELWRVFTAHFLHAAPWLPLHLGMNLLGLLAFAFLVERPLGALRTAVVLGASALGAMGGSALAHYPEVIGASGLVMGLAGATLCLELHSSDRLPATWRLPRRLFLTALGIEALFGFCVPVIAGAAHLGGFVAGYAATWAISGAAHWGQPARSWVRGVAVVLALATLLSFVSAAPLFLRDGAALERHARRVLETSGAGPRRLNDLAWRMVTEMEPPDPALEAALALAERAVAESDRRDPDLLDTLAEVLFARGESTWAVAVIDEAIALAPVDDYFREQRRRFVGERDPGDRPQAPSLPWLDRRPRLDPSRRLLEEEGVAI